MAKTASDTAPPEGRPQPGPTDVLMDEALEEMTLMKGEADQQLAVARVKIRKLEALVAGLRSELGADVKEVS